MIHPKAMVDSSAELAEDIQISAYAVIGPDVEIGPGCRIGHHATLSGPLKVGKNNRIFAHASLGEEPQDIHYQGEPTQLVIGDDNIIREYVSMNRGTLAADGTTRIGHKNFFMTSVHIGHDCWIGDHNIFTNSTALAGHVKVGDWCSLGGFTLVHQFTTIGSYAFTSMGAAVNLDIPPFVLASGNYAKSYGINKVGLQRKGFSKEKISAIQRAYKLLVRQRSNREAVLEQLQPLIEEHTEVQLFVDFIKNSTRGIIK